MPLRRFLVALVVLVAVLALLPFSFHSERYLETATRVEGSQAERVNQELRDGFHSPFVDRVALVVQGIPAPNTPGGEQALTTIGNALKNEPGTSGVVSFLDLRDPLFLGKNGETFVLAGLSSDTGPAEQVVPRLHTLEHSLEAQLRPRYPAVRLTLTGETPLNFDIRAASAKDIRRGESLVIPVTLALLLIAFGSLVAALIPLAVGQLAIATTLALAGLLAHRFHLSILVQNLATMLGLGLGIDYALLMVSRFREAIATGLDGPAASLLAARQAGRTLLISASTVAIGFLALLMVPISEIRSIGLAGCLVAATSVLLTNTLVPAVLSLLGRRIDIGRMPFTPKLDAGHGARPAPPPPPPPAAPGAAPPPTETSKPAKPGAAGASSSSPTPGSPSRSPVYPWSSSPLKPLSSTPASPRATGSLPPPSPCKPLAALNAWTAPVSCKPCAS